MHLELVERAPAPQGDRPRERMMLSGPGELSDVEVVALLLGGGRSLQRARVLLDAVGGLRELARAWPQELVRIPGVGEATATGLAAAVELCRRVEARSLPFASQLRSPRDAEAFLRARFAGVDQEHFMVLGLDARQRVRLVRTVGVGSLSRVEVHPREVFRPLLRAGVHSCLVAHNHPSGDPTPSEADVMLTERLVRVGGFVGIPVLDHLVLGHRAMSSMAELGMMPTEACRDDM